MMEFRWHFASQGYICRCAVKKFKNTPQCIKPQSFLYSWWYLCCRYSGADSRGASGATACKASGRWCVLHVNHQMFLKRATGGGGGRRAPTAGRVGWLPRGLGSHQEPWAQTADLAHTWTPRLSLGKNKVDPIYARWDELTVVQDAKTGAIPSMQAFGSNDITGRCWCHQSSHNSGSVPCNEEF